MSDKHIIDLTMSPLAFFHERIQKASEKLQIKLKDDVEFYLVNMLSEFIQPDKLNAIFEPDTDLMGTPLVLLLKQAVEAPEQKRPAMYRRLGDTSLYFSGYFQEYFNDKTFDIHYFMTMGASAYNQAAQLVTKEDQSISSQTLLTLAENFSQVVDVVAEASDTPAAREASGLLHLYDRWNRCGSQRLKQILLENGITPISVPTKLAN